MIFPRSDSHQRSRTDRQRYSRLPETRHCGGNWTFHRLRRIPEREHHRRQSGDLCRDLGKCGDPQVFLAALGLILIAILMVQTGRGSILIGIIGFPWPEFRSASPLARAFFLAAASFRHVFETGPALRRQYRPGRTRLCVLLRRPLRQRRHAGRRLRAGRISSRRKIPSRQPRLACRRHRHDRGRAYWNLHRYQLYRKCRRRCRWRSHRPGQYRDCCAYFLRRCFARRWSRRFPLTPRRLR